MKIRISFSPEVLSFGIVVPDLFAARIERPSSELKKRTTNRASERVESTET